MPTCSFSSSDYQWTVSAYVLMSGGLLLLGGRMSDLFDRRRMFLIGLTLFTGASLVSGLADSALTLVVARGAQGAGAAMLTPAAMSIVMTTYAGRQRATALAVWGTIASMGIAAGVLFGGLLTSVLDWRAVFFINVPIGIVTLLGALHVVPRGVSTGTGFRGLDVPGAITLVGGLLLLVNAVQSTNSHGWTSPTTVGSAAAAVALLVAFAHIERKVTNPLVTPHIWKLRSLVSASAVMAGVTGALVGVIFLSSLFLQQVLGASAIVTGLEFLPLAAMITLSAAAASHLIGHAGPRLLIALGLVVSAAGALLLEQGRRGRDVRRRRAARLPRHRPRGRPDVRGHLGGRDERGPRARFRSRLGRDDDRPRGRRSARCRGAHRGRRRHHHPGRAGRRPPGCVRVAVAGFLLLIPAAMLPRKSAMAHADGHGLHGH